MSKPRTKMSPAARAKQFMPFSALRGLDEALARKEKVFTEKLELSDEDAQRLNETLLRLSKGDYVSITYYRCGEYITTCGCVRLIDTVFRRLKIDYTEIPFDDISNIKEDAFERNNTKTF